MLVVVFGKETTLLLVNAIKENFMTLICTSGLSGRNLLNLTLMRKAYLGFIEY